MLSLYFDLIKKGETGRNKNSLFLVKKVSFASQGDLGFVVATTRFELATLEL